MNRKCFHEGSTSNPYTPPDCRDLIVRPTHLGGNITDAKKGSWPLVSFTEEWVWAVCLSTFEPISWTKAILSSLYWTAQQIWCGKGMRNFCLKLSQRSHEGTNCFSDPLTQNITQGQNQVLLIYAHTLLSTLEGEVQTLLLPANGHSSSPYIFCTNTLLWVRKSMNH